MSANRARSTLMWLFIFLCAIAVTSTEYAAAHSARAAAARLKLDGAGIILIRPSHEMSGSECDGISSTIPSSITGGFTNHTRRVYLSVDPSVGYRIVTASPGAVRILHARLPSAPSGFLVGGYISSQLGIDAGDFIELDGVVQGPVGVIPIEGDRSAEFDRSILVVGSGQENIDTCAVELPLPLSASSEGIVASRLPQPAARIQVLSRSTPEWLAIGARFADRPTRLAGVAGGVCVALVLAIIYRFRSKEISLYRSFGIGQSDLLVMRLCETVILCTAVPAAWALSWCGQGVLTDVGPASVTAQSVVSMVAVIVGLSVPTALWMNRQDIIVMSKQGF